MGSKKWQLLTLKCAFSPSLSIRYRWPQKQMSKRKEKVERRERWWNEKKVGGMERKKVERKESGMKRMMMERKRNERRWWKGEKESGMKR